MKRNPFDDPGWRRLMARGALITAALTTLAPDVDRDDPPAWFQRATMAADRFAEQAGGDDASYLIVFALDAAIGRGSATLH